MNGAEALEPRLHSCLGPAFAAGNTGDDAGGVERALARAVPGLGAMLAREVVFRARGGGSGTPADPGALAQVLAEVMAAVRLERFAPRIILGADGEPRGLAAIRLASVPEERQQPFPSAAAAAAAFFAHRRALAARNAGRAQAERALHQLRARIAQRITKLEAELAKHRQAIAGRQMGEILVAHQRQVSRGASEAVLPDPYGAPGTTRTIPLDPTRSVAANAERYFKRARRGGRGEPLAAARLAAALRDLDRVAELEKKVAAATAPEALQEICAAAERLRGGGRGPEAGGRELGAKGQGLRRVGRTNEVARLARRFVSTDGFPILVGRDNARNDELTLHVARPDDLWLHVEGHGGSHVVIRREGRADVPRQTLLEAAQLAAYYSQARGQRKVPVHYTLRRYVRKPKGAKPGLVTITQEKTVFATPDPDVVRRLASRAHEAAE
jgi:predicted ribosome quality control (RQC) complex YloA/Tae2 family protein